MLHKERSRGIHHQSRVTVLKGRERRDGVTNVEGSGAEKGGWGTISIVAGQCRRADSGSGSGRA